MADLPEAPPRRFPQLGWCLALYPRLSRPARRRLAVLLLAGALVAQPLVGFARPESETGAAGGNFRAPVAQQSPPTLSGDAPPAGSDAADPYANLAVARALAALGLGAPAAPAAMNNLPVGSQLQVNAYTTGQQRSSSVAMDADGDFVVVWRSVGSSGTDTSGYSIQAQRYNATGTLLGSQFQVNSYTTNDQDYPSVAMDADGDFVVVWHSYGSGGTDTSAFSVQGQRYDAAGTPQGSQFQVNTYTTLFQRHASVAMDAGGDFVVVWQSQGSGATDTSGYSVQGQRYDAAGTPLGSQFQVNTYTTSDQKYPSVALDAGGDFVVVWQSSGSGGTDTALESIQGQRYDTAGTLLGSQFQVNTYTTSTQASAAVAIDADGDFVVVWTSYGSSGTDTSSLSIQSQRYDATGAAAGGEVQVNTYTTGGQGFPSIAMNTDGDFVIVWESGGSGGTDTSSDSVQGQGFDAAGATVGSQFQVNTYTTNFQGRPAVAMDADGDFVVVWESTGSSGTDTSSTSIQAQRYDGADDAAGGEIQVNTYTTGNQRFPKVAMDADGDFVVVWGSGGSGGTDTNVYSIQGQRFDATGTAVGSQFQVNTYTTSAQVNAAVAMDADGDFVVVWQSLGSSGTDTSLISIQGQRYTAAGAAAGSEFQVNTYTTSNQTIPSVAMDADGDFVVVWVSNGSSGTDSSGLSIQGQRYNAVGAVVGSEFQVNTYTTGTQNRPSVAMDADGDFVVAWMSNGSGGTDTSGYSIQGQRYTAAGSAAGSQFQVNTYTTITQNRPSVAMDADGDFVVVWGSTGSSGTDTSGYSVQGQRYTAAGAAAGGEFQVNTYTTNFQRFPSVSMDADGDFTVVWESIGSGGTDTSLASIQARSYDAAGAAVGGEFQVNTYTSDNQRYGSVAMDADGDFAVIWESFGSSGTDTSLASIQVQRYDVANPPTPTPTSTATPTSTNTATPTPSSSPTPQPPTAVDLRYFRAIGLPDRAILVWETASEADTLGFDVLRAASTEGPWTPVNAALIPAMGGATAGWTYVLRDAPGPGIWRYRLEEVGAGGKRTPHATVQARVGPTATGSALFLPNTLREQR